MINIDMLLKLFDTMYDEVIVYNNNYQIVYVNNASFRHYNCSPKDMIGKTFYDLTSDNWWGPSILPYIYKEKKAKAIKQKTFLGTELLTIATPILDENEEIQYVVMNVRDNINLTDLYNPHYIDENIQKDSPEIVAQSKAMKEIINLADRVSKLNITCIISGESGTGKTMLAKYIHLSGGRKNKPFICINCAGIPNQLIETELFGYIGGAFTGAKNSGKKGLFEMAHNGTILLDEISELSLAAQAKLLHVLQEKEFLPVGGSVPVKVDVRVIAATNKNLEKMIALGQFRQDLYYRLNVVDIYIPSLKNRKEDIMPLIYYYINKISKKYNLNRQLSDKVIDALYNYDWPGNTRELQHIIERLIVTVDSIIINTSHLPKNIFGINDQYASELDFNNGTFDEQIDKFKTLVINDSYKKYGSSRKVAAHLGISQTKANNLIKKYLMK